MLTTTLVQWSKHLIQGILVQCGFYLEVFLCDIIPNYIISNIRVDVLGKIIGPSNLVYCLLKIAYNGCLKKEFQKKANIDASPI